jgi:hypothetical protein
MHLIIIITLKYIKQNETELKNKANKSTVMIKTLNFLSELIE